MDLHQLQQYVQQLSLQDKHQLLDWLQAAIELEIADQKEEIPVSFGRKVGQQQRVGKIVYRQEQVRCGKSSCKCFTQDKLHGPYWYSYQRIDGKLKSCYIGKILKLDSANVKDLSALPDKS